MRKILEPNIMHTMKHRSAETELNCLKL